MAKLYYYTHTHWDREWYQPFETFRAQLVQVTRDVVDQLESGKLQKFYLDGQAIVFEDLMELDPSLKPRIQKLMASGQLSAGPWYVLADQLLVGGESLIRNLKIGLAETRKFGEPTMIGYCPDTFGHSQDLPRILNGFGIKNAFIWRGVPLLEAPTFFWRSPDGSQVLAYHITHGYYQTAMHEHGYATTNGANGAGVEKLASALLPWVGLEKEPGASSFNKIIDGALLPIGGDHFGPPRDLLATVSQLNKYYRDQGKPLELTPTTLMEFIKLVEAGIKSPASVKTIDGELRDNTAALSYARGYLLDGVLSTRLYLKAANRLTEYLLGRVCEPLYSVLNAFGLMDYPGAEMDYAWKLLMKNHPHDSICGCSVDAVHREMMTRSARIDDLVAALQQKAADIVSGAKKLPGVSALDPVIEPDMASLINLSRAHCGPIRAEWSMTPGSDFPLFSEMVQVEEKTEVDRLFSGWGILPYYKPVDLYKGWIWSAQMPSFGAANIEWPPRTIDQSVPVVEAKRTRLSNGLIDVTVDADGTLSARALVAGKRVTYKLGHKLIDVGDGGDSYNFDPVPKDNPVVAKFVSATVKKRGPLVGSLVLTYEIAIPEGVVESGSYKRDPADELSKLKLLKRGPRKIKHEIKTEISLKRGVPVLWFETNWNNQSTDHRLEVVFDTGNTIFTAFAENHFSLAARHHNRKGKTAALPVPAGCESPPERFPCQRFFIANGQVFLNCGLPEYGVEGSRASITLLRAISWLSKNRLWTRGGGAGPNIAVPEANCIGPNKTVYGWAPVMVAADKSAYNVMTDSLATEAYKLAEQFEGAGWAAFSKGAPALPSGSWLNWNNDAVAMVAMYTRPSDNQVFVRLLNVTMSPQRLSLTTAFKVSAAALVRLDEAEESKLPFKSKGSTSTSAELTFQPNELKTVMLKLAGSN